MAVVRDRGENWELEIFPGIESVEIIDEADKGYRATLGFDPDTQRHVVANVLYAKDKFPIEDVLKKVETLRTCSTCDTLDRERLKLESIEVQQSPIQARAVSSPPLAQGLGSTPVPLSKSVSPGIKDMFANLVLDAYLTVPGKYFLGLMLDDQSLMESAYPGDEEGTQKFMGEMIDFMSGDIEFMRSPEQAKEFMSVAYGKTPDDKNGGGVAANKRKGLPSEYAVIY